MFIVTYYKFGNRWFLDSPDYIESGGEPDDLERIGAFHDLLEIAAEGETTIRFQMDVQPFEGADVGVLAGSSGEDTGGYYHISSYNGHPLDVELWFNTFLYFKPQDLPQNIYFKKVPLAERQH